ncbi:uncharacterized protein ALTATR162_LOCUS9790 [Alternaria atra]|uniref:Rhodopsin domain-containing protein n=1 Tax=Alternaria atra TaxID=119953 RepID=A0A8J2I7Z2_9PLEO|nr:uncharacterized protein ALTATR162_LOCUS9790 [Alternaria atra]CAG5181650.1 unnamed protein product [Alternaria atra]
MDQLPPAQLAKLAQENQGPATKAIVIAFTTISFICVCLRFFTRITFQHNVGWEDYSIALSMCFSIAMAVCQVYQVQWGSGKHMMFLDLVAAVNILKYLYFSILAYCISLTLTKISILLQYRRIFTLREMQIPIYVVFGICVAYGIESVTTGIFSCIPVDAFWEVTKKPTARCLNENALYYANASLNIVTDLLVAVLPVKAIWDLQIPKMQKIAVTIILTLGWFVCIVSILRLHALVVLAQHPEDTTWYSTATAYWSTIEVNLAIVCASTPALKLLVVKVIPAFSTRNGSWGYGPNSGTKQNKSGKFVELSNKIPPSTAMEDFELGDTPPITALPAVSYGPGRKAIYVQHDFERHFKGNGRDSESESERHLVSISCNVMVRH